MNREQAMKLAEAVRDTVILDVCKYEISSNGSTCARQRDLAAIVDVQVAQAWQQEPVGWFDVEMDNMYTASELADGSPGLIPLYTAPPFVAVPDGLIAELDWCISEGNRGPRTLKCLDRVRSILLVAAPKPEGG